MFDVTTPNESDANRIASIHIAAMQSNMLLHAQFPTRGSLRSLHRYLVDDTALHLRNVSKGILVARDSDSQDIVGFVKWELPSKPGQTEDEELDWPEDCDRKYIDEYYALAKEAELRAIGRMHCCHFSFLCTDPAWQGLGIGSLLSQAVMDKAEKIGLPVYLESTMAAVPFYERLNFERIGGFKMAIPGRDDPNEKEIYEEVCLLWKLGGCRE
ncbi:acyl-CoA N-acyltransferase [Xylariales sp. AK1849]|nr:acyl-CoA N-acyltransferase [Xylariales sp. AK1849]